MDETTGNNADAIDIALMTPTDLALDEDLSAFADAQLPAERKAELRARLAADPALAERLARFGQVGAALRALPIREAPAELLVELKERIRSERESHRSARRPAPRATRRLWTRAGGAVLSAAAALTLFLTVDTGWDGEPGSSTDVTRQMLADASEEDLGVVFEYETLEDIEVLEDLEVLEMLVALQPVGRS